MANERIMWIAEDSYKLVTQKKGLEKRGYVVNFLELVLRDIFREEKPGFAIEDVRKVMANYKEKTDLLLIDDVVESGEEGLGIVKTLRNEGIYDGRSMIYASLLRLGKQAVSHLILQTGADFAFNGESARELSNAIQAAFGKAIPPDYMSYDVNKYEVNKNGIIVPKGK